MFRSPLWVCIGLFDLSHSFTLQPRSFTSPVKRYHNQRAVEAFSSLKSRQEDEEEQEQLLEAVQSLADFHQGTWKGKATSFTVTADVAAGIVQQKVSPEYQVSIQLLPPAASPDDYSWTETYSWQNNDDMVVAAARKVPLASSHTDVDAVDGSYSLDSTLPNLPSVVTGTEKLCSFGVEHCIAASDDRRFRCWALYNVENTLMRIVVCDEKRSVDTKEIDTDAKNKNTITAADLIEMESDVDRLVNKLVVGASDTGDGENKSSSESDSIGRKNSLEDRLEKLNQALSKEEGTSTSSGGNRKLEPHIMSLLEMASGVWLGDAVIRDVSAKEAKGFGSSKISQTPPATFAAWNVGVQKVAFRWMWNFGEEIRQVIDVGKSLGIPMDAVAGLSGSVCLNESMSRRIPKADRRVYIDWDGGNVVGFLLGPVCIQVPRYLQFPASSSGRSRIIFTEFGLFQSTPYPQATKEAASDLAATMIADQEDAVELPDLVLSKVARVYDAQGTLKQGVSSFYTMKRFAIEGEDE